MKGGGGGEVTSEITRKKMIKINEKRDHQNEIGDKIQIQYLNL